MNMTENGKVVAIYLMGGAGLTEAHVETPIDLVTKINEITDLVSSIVVIISMVITTYFLVRKNIKKKKKKR